VKCYTPDIVAAAVAAAVTAAVVAVAVAVVVAAHFFFPTLNFQVSTFNFQRPILS
jgi:cbb3-type cytochrome oxidase subunit 1